jgi:hypothetical protein
MTDVDQREDSLKQRERALDDREKDLESKCSFPLLASIGNNFIPFNHGINLLLGREKILSEREKVLEQKLSR